MTIMDGFNTDFYYTDPKKLTDHQRLQVRVACICNTSISDGINEIKNSSTEVIEAALEQEKATSNRKSLIKRLEATLRKMAKNERS